MLKRLRRLWFRESNAYLRESREWLAFWVYWYGFIPGTHPGIVADWLADHHRFDDERRLREEMQFCDRMAARVEGV